MNQYKKEIAKGHIGLIWLSGKEAGIYALTEIITDPELMEDTAAEKKYWTDSEDKDKEGSKLKVKIRILKYMLNRPLTKEIIRNKNGLENLSILKQSRGTNFNVTSSEWNILKELIEK